jgi:hypothetical protein
LWGRGRKADETEGRGTMITFCYKLCTLGTWADVLYRFRTHDMTHDVMDRGQESVLDGLDCS